jgi:hypothetical protein
MFAVLNILFNFVYHSTKPTIGGSYTGMVLNGCILLYRMTFAAT